ncbi:MAG: UxaA family hydrolase [Candidatus Nanopelagicales bacterium]
MSIIDKNTTFLGYRRENGRVGVRNHVIILPLDDLSNAAAEAVAHNIKGAMAIPHPYGRLQFGADLDLHFRTLIGTGCNPNVAAVVVIGIEDGWTQKVVEGIKRHRQAGGGLRHRAARRPRHHHARQQGGHANTCSGPARSSARSAPIAELWVSTKCGESDTTSGCGANPTVGNAFDKLHPLGTYLCFGETTELTGGEHIVAARCANDDVREQFMFMFNRYQDVINRHKTSDLSDSQPTKGNIAGGLTTIEEKALGNIQKIGKMCTVDGVIDKAEMPTHPGLWFMDSSSAAAEMVTLCAASGYAVHFFPTGQGNVIGNPILPVIKLCANPRTVRTMSEHIDVDVTGLLQREITLDQAGDKLLENMLRTANGRLTAAEALGHREFVLTRLYESRMTTMARIVITEFMDERAVAQLAAHARRDLCTRRWWTTRRSLTRLAAERRCAHRSQPHPGAWRLCWPR